MKWQGIGLAGYFCTLLIRETCIVYTRVFPTQHGRKTENKVQATKGYTKKGQVAD